MNSNFHNTHSSAARFAGAILGLALIGSHSLTAADWANWRGPNYNGSTSESDLPAEFGPETGVKWTVELPGPSAATPIVLGDKVFLSSVNSRQQTLQALCLDRNSGAPLWSRDVGFGVSKDNRSNYASNSPVSDGERVVFFYGTGDLVAFDLEGEQLWKRNIQKDYGDFSFLWTFSTSPAIYNGILYMQVLQRDTPVNGKGKNGAESYILALDPATGDEKWRHVRPAKARSESLEAFTTPMWHDGQLLIVGGDCLTAHNPETGEELWRWGTWNPARITHWRLVPSAVAGKGVVLACAPKGEPIFAIKADGSGVLDDSMIAWKSDPRESGLSSDVPTPAFDGEHFYVLSDQGRGLLAKVDPEDGSVVWSAELPDRERWRASPTVADGKVYIMNHASTVVVFDADSGELLNQAEFGDNDRDSRSGVVAAHGDLFIRTNGKLFCIGG